ncbi:uncharacterized protein LOC114288645 [Camellia sinensis]|uniref:uncharacterized protein LOC114288645 n=1 Tax=Camellia sinensis TaxID=4442 RepID=UPI001036271F|nr:uncharacterized protein LOC114288645 [Camellia sinensis]
MAWAKMTWYKWNLRVAILVSLYFQILLVFIAPLRKRRGNKIIILLIWGAYLLADWVAVFAIGLISHYQANNCDNYCVNKDLLAFWAPFLLLHLGGPDTITAFSFEDNGLWLRHFVGLVIQLAVVAYVFLQSFPNQIWIPTVLVFFAGTIKYAERTRAQYLAYLGSFDVSMHQSVVASWELERFSDHFGDEESQASLTGIDVLENGYNLLQILRGLIASRSPRFRELASYSFFSKRSSEDAFRVIEAELNFFYDVLYTKMEVVHCWTGYFLRFIFSFLIVVSFALFASSHHKHQFHHFDIVVTYTLLIGAVGLDLVSLLMLIFSHWTVVLLSNPKAKNIVNEIQEMFFLYDKRSQRFNFIPQHSLISYCINIHQRRFKWFDKAVEIFRLDNFLYEIQYIRTERLQKTDLKSLIFKKLKEKADPRRKSQDTELPAEDLWGQNCFIPLWIRYSTSKEVEYDRKLLMWHIATEICYFRDEPNANNREFCKILSEYMLYLLVMQPTMTSTVPGIQQIRIRDMCTKMFNDVKMILDSHTNNSNPLPRRRKPKTESSLSEDLVSKILDSVLSKTIERGESLLHDACMLADDLMNGFQSETRWEIMSNVWFDLLYYAATHCGANAHAKLVSEGGELITSLWLLVSHFGLGEEMGEQISASSIHKDSLGFFFPKVS